VDPRGVVFLEARERQEVPKATLLATAEGFSLGEARFTVKLSLPWWTGQFALNKCVNQFLS
jgi:hypothetical protein